MLSFLLLVCEFKRSGPAPTPAAPPPRWSWSATVVCERRRLVPPPLPEPEPFLIRALSPCDNLRFLLLLAALSSCDDFRLLEAVAGEDGDGDDAVAATSAPSPVTSSSTTEVRLAARSSTLKAAFCCTRLPKTPGW